MSNRLRRGVHLLDDKRSSCAKGFASLADAQVWLSPRCGRRWRDALEWNMST